MNQFIPDEFKNYLTILNQVFEIEKKLTKLKKSNSIQRNVDRVKDVFQDSLLPDDMGLMYYDPSGENYDETRTDCEASIAGESTENLKIVEVIKPIIRICMKDGSSRILQRAVVIVESNKE